MTALAKALLASLRVLGTPERAAGAKAYLKSDLAFFGVTAPELRGAVKAALRAMPVVNRRELFATVDALWPARVFELRAAAVELLAHRIELVTPASLTALRRLLGDSHTWALVDPLSTAVVGKLYARAPEVATTLDQWAVHRDFWIRRAAMLAHLPQLRRGGGDFARFARYAEAMLDEREFFIRKAIGWVLRETSKRRPELVDAWITPRIARVSGVTLREALKYLPATRQRALVAARAARERPAPRGATASTRSRARPERAASSVRSRGRS